MNDAMPLPAPLLREVPRFGTAPRSAGQRRPIVLVLGMDRSGTSLCSDVLSTLGIDMADKVIARGAPPLCPDNAKGLWDRWEIVDFHERILGFFNRGYDTPFHDFGLPVAWWADPRVAETRREIVAFLDKRMGPEPFGFKDPRTVRLMPIWHQITKELKLAPKIIYCLRNPAQVARSLHDRNGIRLDLGEYRWLSYNIDFFRYTRNVEICTIEYETWFDDHLANLKKIKKFLQLPDEQPQFDIDMAISEIVDNALRHDDLRLGEASQPLIRSVYRLARRADHDPAARDQVQDIGVQFLSFQQVQRAFQREFEQASALADQVPALSEKSADLQALVSEREAQLAAASKKSADLQALVSERETQLASVSAQARESATRATEMSAELERQKAAHAAIVEQRDALASSAEDMRSEITRLTEVLAAAQVREEELESIRRQVTALREAVVQAEEEAREWSAAEAAIRTDMADAMRAAQGRSEQVAMLKSEISHARQAGRAALQALAASRLATVNREPRLGWRQSLRRLFGFAGNA